MHFSRTICVLIKWRGSLQLILLRGSIIRHLAEYVTGPDVRN
jgi:hypothetical protein